MKDITNRKGKDVYELQFSYKGKIYKNIARNKVVGLVGDRNECPSCDELFNSITAFDRHRTGNFGINRRCLTVDEMLAKGMAKNYAGFWVTKLMDEEYVSTL